MIVYKGVLKTKVLHSVDSNTYFCVPLNTDVEGTVDDDAVYTSQSAEQEGDITTQNVTTDTNCIAITCLSTLRKKFAAKLFLTIAVAVVCWFLLFWVSMNTFLAYFEQGRAWYRFIPIALMAFFAFIYTVQAYNPMLHDLYGHWVNLRTGSTNLRGGFRIKKKE